MPDAIDEVYSVLARSLRGRLLRQHDAEYVQAHTIWNAAAQRRPALIAQCAGVADVAAAVKPASAAGVATAIRCGGHSLAGFSSCEGGLVIDLCALRGVGLDAANRVATVQGGCLLGTIDTATQRAGLVYPAGVVSHTGAAGLILGGGTGWLTRKFGLSCDNVEGFTLVTAEGEIVRANARENEDLFWALRGGGGNFGVVVEFQLKLHPLTHVLLGCAYYGEEDIADRLRFFREFMPDAPAELKWNLGLRLGPEHADCPEELRGRPVLSESLLWAGNEAEGRELFRRLYSRDSPQAVKIEVFLFLKLQTMADAEFPHGRRYYTKSGYFKSLSDASISRMIAALGSVPSHETQIELVYLGGAAAKISADDTAFGDRSSPFILNLLAAWDEPERDAENASWVRTLFADLRPEMTPGVYVNFMSGDEDDRVKEAYSVRWEKLLAVKRKYDPRNFFRLNQNIRAAKS
ncbi:MAG TPA: FAD-binding protein [Candidatus Acidoferrales bacterium]|nr:FAD-binding protein [Candidatus Acidoferrales bacterium]